MTTPPSGKIAANVRAEVARKRIRQVDLAASLDMTQQALSRRLTGSVPLTADQVAALAIALGVSVGTLYGETATAVPA